MNTFKNYATIHLQLIQIDAFKIVCVANKTEDLNLSLLNMISGKNDLKTSTKPKSC